jgi:serine/threonine-protein kinase
MPTPSPSLELQPGERLGRYVVEQLIGKGGMGRVYRARDPQLGRRVAIKVLALVDTDPAVRGEAAARMQREARVAAAFSHPNAVAVYDVGEVGGEPFIAMELVAGRPLRAFVGDPTVPTADKLRWLADVARALAAAHRAGLVHRDVKPDNVIVGDDGIVKLLDFGVARRIGGEVDPLASTGDGTLTVEGGIVGTPAYMAPEQLNAERVDARADQFSWAAMAWELLAGSRLWKQSGAQLVAAILTQPAPPLSISGVSREIADAIARALSKAAAQRFPDMDTIVAIVDGTGATPERRAVPRRRLWPAIAAALIGVTIGLPVGHSRRVLTPVAQARVAGSSIVERGFHLCGPDWICEGRLVSWCDDARHQIACCPPGRAPIRRDGVCGCPPGGTPGDGSCPALHGVREYQRYLADWYQATVAHGIDCDGHHWTREQLIGLGITMIPDSAGYMRANLSHATMVDSAAQICLLRVLNGGAVDPPPIGFEYVDILFQE